MEFGVIYLTIPNGIPSNIPNSIILENFYWNAHKILTKYNNDAKTAYCTLCWRVFD